MSKTGKFSALAEFRQQQTDTEVAEPVQSEAPDTIGPPEPDEVEPEAEPTAHRPRVEPAPRPKATRPVGRPPGKRSDPEWKLYSHFLKRSTQRAAMTLLFEYDDGRDLSDVLQSLLDKWVSRQRAKS